MVYSTTIAPSQRYLKGPHQDTRASMSRALWHNAEMQDGVKHFLAAHSQLSLVQLYASPWRSLGMSFALQHHHSTFSKGHIKSFPMRGADTSFAQERERSAGAIVPFLCLHGRFGQWTFSCCEISSYELPMSYACAAHIHVNSYAYRT